MNDSLSERYAAALLPDTCRVLGRRLQPLCIGHVITLERLRSPYMIESRPPDAADLAQAVTVCSWPWPEIRDRIARGRRFAWRLRWLSWRASWDLRSVITWRTYLETGLGAPRRWNPDPRRSAPLTCPHWLTLQARLQRELSMSLDAALGTPVRLAQWLVAQADEERGLGSLVTPEDEAIVAGRPVTVVSEAARN